MRGGDLDHIDVRRNIRQDPLHMSQTSRQHGQPVRHFYLIILHNIHQVSHDFCHIDLPHVHAAVFHEKPVDILIQHSLIRTLFEFPDAEHCLLNQTYIPQSYALHSFSDHLPIMLCEPAHHSHIDPDDLSIPDLYVSRMRVRMEEPVIH